MLTSDDMHKQQSPSTPMPRASSSSHPNVDDMFRTESFDGQNLDDGSDDDDGELTWSCERHPLTHTQTLLHLLRLPRGVERPKTYLVASPTSTKTARPDAARSASSTSQTSHGGISHSASARLVS